MWNSRKNSLQGSYKKNGQCTAVFFGMDFWFGLLRNEKGIIRLVNISKLPEVAPVLVKFHSLGSLIGWNYDNTSPLLPGFLCDCPLDIDFVFYIALTNHLNLNLKIDSQWSNNSSKDFNTISRHTVWVPLQHIRSFRGGLRRDSCLSYIHLIRLLFSERTCPKNRNYSEHFVKAIEADLVYALVRFYIWPRIYPFSALKITLLFLYIIQKITCLKRIDKTEADPLGLVTYKKYFSQKNAFHQVPQQEIFSFVLIFDGPPNDGEKRTSPPVWKVGRNMAGIKRQGLRLTPLDKTNLWSFKPASRPQQRIYTGTPGARRLSCLPERELVIRGFSSSLIAIVNTAKRIPYCFCKKDVRKRPLKKKSYITSRPHFPLRGLPLGRLRPGRFRCFAS